MSAVDTAWVLVAAILVFTMQAGFLCIESGVTRSKNAINVAMKNMADFAVAITVFWALGFGVMFGASASGLLGQDLYLPALGVDGDPWLATFFLFQALFCATATTIVSGAVAERTPFAAYLAIAVMVSALVYPVFGHWAWGSLYSGDPGWLERLGFVDFAGSTVVHSVGGWVALAAVNTVGPRAGRFPPGETPRPIPAGNLPVAILGGLLLFVGWFGFNGGSTLALTEAVPGILTNTILAGVAGVLSGMVLGWRLRHYAEVLYALNGGIAGLVAITAGAHAVGSGAALAIGAVGGLIAVFGHELLLRLRIDDAVSAIPAHLMAGVWGTLAVGLFGVPESLGTGLSRMDQLLVQALGMIVCGLWAFGVSYLLFRILQRLMPLRVAPEAERTGLNVAEHGARTELFELLEVMESHQTRGDTQRRVPVDPFTEVGEIAASYNRVCEALENAVEQTRNIVRDLRDGVVTWNDQGVLTSMNPGAEALFGVRSEAMAGRPVDALLRQPAPAPGERSEVRARGPDAELRILEVQVSAGRAGSGARFSGMVRDVTDRKRLEEQLYHERDLAQVTLGSIADGVITTDESGRVRFMNPMAERLTGWSREAAQAHSIARIYQLVDGETRKPLPNTARTVLGSGHPVAHKETRHLRRRDGGTCPVRDSGAPIRNLEGHTVGAVVIFQDVTEPEALARELQHQASHDALTGLLNRREFERRLADALQEEGAGHVLCFLDMDQFKVVNDTCGHAAGDELLRQFTGLLRAELRASDVLARLGGDEFGILFRDCPVEQARQRADAMRQGIEDYRFAWHERVFSVGVSIGLVECGGGRMGDLTSALSAADAACYMAKEAGRNRVHVHTPDDQHQMALQGELSWVSRLQDALDRDRLRLYAQPIVPTDGDADTPCHHEILVRVEEGGEIITPGAFMPAAERYNLMPRIDRWVVSNTLAWLADACRAGGDPGLWTVNLSGASLSDERFRAELLDMVRRAGFPPGVLCFEVTESAAIAQLSQVARFMGEVKALGCLFALDDFGSGLSSFAYLKQLPVDFLKIDGSFVKDIVDDPADRALVEAINTVGHTLGLSTIGEYVENDNIMTMLRTMGVDYGQGFHLGRPRPLADVSRVVVMPR